MGTVTLLETTTRKPITLIGERAGICWGADTSVPEKNYQRGLDCIQSVHGRTLEFVNVEMILDGYSARVIREWYTHIGGAPTRLQASTRYINYGEFEYIVPDSVKDIPLARATYGNAMYTIQKAAEELEKIGVPREDAANLLPLGMCTKVVDKRNLRNLIDMSRQRMCNRAYWEFQDLFRNICEALAFYSDEWVYITTHLFHAKCVPNKICPEKHGCGMYPKSGEAK